MYAFEVSRPETVDVAAGQLSSDEDAKVLAGGQTLIPTMKQRLAAPSSLIDLSKIADLKGIERQGEALGIGAMTTHAEVAASSDVAEAIPALATVAGAIGDPQVRHSGTLGGSLANNDPAADYPAAVLGLDAIIVTNKRQIAADDYFTGLFSTALERDEIITGVGFPVPRRAGYAKFEQRASRYALVGVFVAETAGGVRVAVTGAGADGVFRSGDLEQALTADFSVAAAEGITVAPDGLLSDLHAGSDYRAALIPVLAGRAVAAALA